MVFERFLRVTTLVSALFAAGCAATMGGGAGAAAGVSAGATATVGSYEPGVPAPPKASATWSASVELKLCTAGTNGISYLAALKQVRQMDGETVEAAADAPRNQGWAERFSQIAKTTKVEDCKEKVDGLLGEVGARHAKARTLCDLRLGDGGGAAFKDDTRAELDAVRTTLKDAAGKAKLAECQSTAASAEPTVRALVDQANEACSPRRADHEVVCSDALASYCQGTGPAPDAACLDRASSTDVTARGASETNAASRGLAGAGLESAILTGAADFFVERAEQEMSLFAVEVVGRELCSDDSAARPLLPKTCELLGPPPKGQDASTLGPTPAAIRAAAKADLQALPTTVVAKIKDHDKILACATAFGLAAAEEVGHGAALVDVLKDPTAVLENKWVLATCSPGAQSDIKNLAEYLTRFLAGAPGDVADRLRSGDVERLVSTSRELTNAPKDARSIGAALTEPGKVLAKVLRRLVELDRAIAAYHADPKPERRVVMVIAAIQTVEPILDYLARSSPNRGDIHTAIDFFADVLNHQYTDAIVAASSFRVTQVFPPNARNLLTLAAGFAQADSSDDVKKTLDDAALPLGSWRRKNVGRWGATLTGMVGGFVGYELVTEQPNAFQYVTNGGSLAPTLAVGPDIHYGLGGSRLGLQITVLDLGALASIRLDTPQVKDEATDQTATTNAKAESTPDVRVEQVFAPGLFAYFGWGPFAFGPMASFVPSLRPYKDAAGDAKPLSVWRVGAVVAVDVSVLPLF